MTKEEFEHRLDSLIGEYIRDDNNDDFDISCTYSWSGNDRKWMFDLTLKKQK